MLANRRTEATQVQYNPAPADTRMPRETLLVVTVHELIRPAVLMRAVQMDEVTRADMPAMTASKAENQGIQGYLRVYSIIPL